MDTRDDRTPYDYDDTQMIKLRGEVPSTRVGIQEHMKARGSEPGYLPLVEQGTYHVEKIKQMVTEAKNTPNARPSLVFEKVECQSIMLEIARGIKE